MSTARLAPTSLAVLLAMALPACGGGPALVELAPTSVQLFGRGQRAEVHATPRQRNGKPIPDAPCRWASSDEKVVTVSARHNDATLTSTGPGAASVTCTAGQVTATLQVAVRVVARVEAPATIKLTLTDERAATPLAARAFDDQGAPVAGRLVYTRCADESVCRGDSRGQLWPTGPGKTSATVEVEGTGTQLEVTVVDERSELTRPKLMKRGYMEDLEREVARKQAAEAAAERKAAEGAPRR